MHSSERRRLLAGPDSGTTQNLFGVWGSGPNDVFAVGDGTILHSSNDGAAWQAQTSGTTQTLSGVWGSGPNDVFAVGDGGVILHSSNDGASWQAQTSGSHAILSGVWGSGPNDVFAVGGNGVILHSCNDGASWQAQTSGTTQSLDGVWGSGPNDVFAVGTGVDRDPALTVHWAPGRPRTRDRRSRLKRRLGERPQRRLRRGPDRHDPALGERRRLVAAQTSGSPPTAQLFGVWGAGPNDVFAVGVGGVILHSSNDGASWAAQISGTTQDLFGVWGSGPNDVFAVGYNGADPALDQRRRLLADPELGDHADPLTGVWGSGPNDVFAVGQNGVILHSTNDGASWQAQNSGTTQILEASGGAAQATSSPWAGGVILHSTNDGASWQAQSVGPRRTSIDVWGSGPNDVFAVGL